MVTTKRPAHGVKCGNHSQDTWHATAREVEDCFKGRLEQRHEAMDRLATQHDRNEQVRRSVLGTGANPQPSPREIGSRAAAQARRAAAPQRANTVRPIGGQQYRDYEQDARPATEPMRNYVLSLLQGKDLSALESETDRAVVEAVAPGLLAEDGEIAAALSFNSARWLIDHLKPLPAKPKSAKATGSVAYAKVNALLEQVPDGRYAVPIDGKPHFYVVKPAFNGATYRVVKEQASDELFKMWPPQQEAALKAILAYGLEKAGLLYAETMQQCRKCGRAIGDVNNPYKPYGYGPECGPKAMGGL